VARRAALCSLALAVPLLAGRPARGELILFDDQGWTLFTEGRINSFFSLGHGNAFPTPTFNPNMGVNGQAPQHQLTGANGELFSAGYSTDQEYPGGNYFGERVRSGFLGSILAFGMKRRLSERTTINSYIAFWGTSETFARDRNTDAGRSTSKGFDMREGWVAFQGSWGEVIAGRQSGMLGGISTEIDYLYGHNFGVGLPCVEYYYPTCGHIGTGALGPGYSGGFVYATPSLAGLSLKVGLYDPVRLLGAAERVPYPRPEGALTFERRISPSLMFKLQAEAMYQYLAQLASPRTDRVWGVAAGGRIEAGPLRLGAAVFQGKGLGSYIALQNATATFNGATRELRYFTGMYAQAAMVFGDEQVSLGAGRVLDHQLDSDKVDPGNSILKTQTGISVGFYHHLNDNLVLGLDYFFFRTDWWGAPNSTNALDASGNVVATILPGVLTPEKQVVHFFNLGATFYW
jgi:hypothetical protein